MEHQRATLFVRSGFCVSDSQRLSSMAIGIAPSLAFDSSVERDGAADHDPDATRGWQRIPAVRETAKLDEQLAN
jgi:hypothetical protein